MIAELGVGDLFFCNLITTYLDGFTRMSAENVGGKSDYATVDRNAMSALVMATKMLSM